MKKFSLLMYLFLFVAISLSAQKRVEHYFSFPLSEVSDLQKLTQVISIDNLKDGRVFAYANEKEFANFLLLGISYEKLQNPSTLFQPKMSNSKDGMKEWDSYPTYSAYVAIMNQFATDYPNLCTVESIGTSVEGRQILVAKISDNVNQEEAEPEFFYTGTMHGDETTGFILMMRLIDYLLSNYPADAQVANLVNNMEIYINPAANPDGTYAGGDNNIFGATRSNANGVDLNRNFHDPEDGEHPDGNSWQPETVAMMNFADAHTFVMSANHHGGAEVVNYPWDTWVTRHADDNWFQTVCHTFADLAQANSPAGYMDGWDDGITNGYDWYTTSGCRQDYMNYFHGCREVTTELSDVKLVAENQLNAHWGYLKESFLAYMEECLKGIHGTVKNAENQPLAATITVLDHDNNNAQVFTDPQVGDYYRLIAPGTYDLMFSSYGYISQIIENVIVVQDQITPLNVVLQPAQTTTVTGTVTDISNGSAIEGASIQVLDVELPIIYTNAAGQFSIPGVMEGIYTFRVVKDGYSSISSVENITVENNTLNFALTVSTAISFETATIPEDWTFGGSQNWTISTDEAYDGTYSIKSGAIGDNQESIIQVQIATTQNGDISFFKKVSSEQGYDKLYFYIDGTEKGNWSGSVDWSEESFPVTAGEHTFKWKYAKDGSATGGSDCAWVDYVTFPPSGSVNNAPAFTSSPITTAIINTQYNYQIATSDSDGDALSLTCNTNAAWLVFTANNGQGTLIGTPTTAGTFNVQLSLNDGEAFVTQNFTINVTSGDVAPEFNSAPITAALAGAQYTYNASAVDANGDAISFTAVVPAWLVFTDNNNNTATITGVPSAENVGNHNISIVAHAGGLTTTQTFTIVVSQQNQAPVFTSIPLDGCAVNQEYSYTVVATDANNDDLTLTATAPSWLSFTDNGDGSGVLTGIPSSSEMGAHPIVITATDGELETEQSFSINVSITSSLNFNANNFDFEIWPVPAEKNINVICNIVKQNKLNISILDISGRILFSVENIETEEGLFHHEINIEALSEGLYFVRLSIGSESFTKKLIKY